MLAGYLRRSLYLTTLNATYESQIMSSIYSYRGNLKSAGSRCLPSLFHLDKGPQDEIKKRAELALHDRNYRFFTHGLIDDDVCLPYMVP